MEFLDTGVLIDLSSLMMYHMVRVIYQDKKGHTLPYGFWVGVFLKHLQVPVRVWTFQTT